MDIKDNKKILISAYACEPNKGSEPAVGWAYVLKASREFDEVFVVTRANNKPNIDEFLKENPNKLKNVKFLYFDLPKVLSFWKKGLRGVQLYAYLWEIFLPIFLLKKKIKPKSFDIAQRVTFVNYRYPSFLWLFGKKFIFGPIGGGETYPLSLLSIFSLKGKIKEIIRMLWQRISLLDPLVLLTLYKADKIIAVTDETKNILPWFARKKTKVEPATLIVWKEIISKSKKFKDCKEIKKDRTKLKLLYVGRILELKGIYLILSAIKELKSEIPIEFTIVGDGPDKLFFEELIKKWGLKEVVKITGWVKQEKLYKYYCSHDIFVFPSLHDSGGLVVLEAKKYGLPVIVLNFGGPKYLVNNEDYIIDSADVCSIIKELKKIFVDYFNLKIKATKQI